MADSGATADSGPAAGPDRPGQDPPRPHRPGPDRTAPGTASGGIWPRWMHRRRQKIIAEIERNRRGEYTVPTWVLVVLLVVVVVGWAALVILS